MNRFFLSSKTNLVLYTVMHFLVDLSCIFYLMGMVYMMLPDPASRVQAAVLYNMMAFALPMLLGFLADMTGFNAFTSCLGCVMILAVYLSVPQPWTAAVIIGIGNGLFHIGGGRQVLQDAGRRFAPAGIFISSGALGVYLGRTLSASFRQLVFVSMWAALAVSAVLLLICGIFQRPVRKRSRIGKQCFSSWLLIFSAFIFVVVIIRSYYGFVAVYEWNTTFLSGLIFTLCIVAGKFCGGIAADHLGLMPACILSLGGGAVLALLSAGSPAAACISILLFNMTMPITLTLLADAWKELPGFAFGTLMMALFLGTVPNMVFHVSWVSGTTGMALLCLASLGLLAAASILKKKKL